MVVWKYHASLKRHFVVCFSVKTVQASFLQIIFQCTFENISIPLSDSTA